ncbi:hypothetical protein [Candidatus Electronema sp. PJ]|uniref:hypothetical protein n=1 Tax=Candidatus Electronema sp. PJ TaxID=3401572 RepID=UPI003AA90CD8
MARKEFYRLGKKFESAKLRCNSARKQLGQAKLLFYRLQLLGKRGTLLPCSFNFAAI